MRKVILECILFFKKVAFPKLSLNSLKVGETIPTIEDVEKHWKKAKWVATQKKFDEKKLKIFQSNIDRAKIFFKNN
jgi:hypothetical protein